MINGTVTVTISTGLEGYILEYSRDSITWLEYTNGITYDTDGIIYARLRKGSEISNVLTGNITNIDKEKPEVGTIIPRTNGARFGGTDNKGIIGYGYNESSTNEPSWIEVTKTEDLTDINIENLTADTTYYIWVKDEANNTANKAFTTGTMPTLDTDLETGNISFNYTPNTWTSGNVTVTIATSITGFTLQYSKDGTTWSNYTSGVQYTTNGTIYARLTDGTNTTDVLTGNITNIDRLQPNTFAINPTATTNSITCEVSTVTDALATSTNGSSGIAKIEYKLDSGTYSENTRTWTGLTQGSSHTVYMRATDNAGNMREVSKAITVGTVPVGTGNITFSYSTTDWTNGNVTVTLSTSQTGYTLQYRKDHGTWTNCTTGVEFTANGIIDARLWDGTNAGAIATGNVENIDKVDPTISLTVLSGGATYSVADTGSGVVRVEMWKHGSGDDVDLLQSLAYETSINPSEIVSETVLNLAYSWTHTIRVYDEAGNLASKVFMPLPNYGPSI